MIMSNGQLMRICIMQALVRLDFLTEFAIFLISDLSTSPP